MPVFFFICFIFIYFGYKKSCSRVDNNRIMAIIYIMEKEKVGYTTIRLRTEHADRLRSLAAEMDVSIPDAVREVFRVYDSSMRESQEMQALKRIERLLRVNISVYTDILYQNKITFDKPEE